MLFYKRVVRNKFDINVFIVNYIRDFKMFK